ncbi:MAG TPA: O-antigen ligase family protein [Mucilaginibacter sp.]|jgi:O-antigen ligase|nr:O-antigen ligase family protein [Mucilaginibacter sp.]
MSLLFPTRDSLANRISFYHLAAFLVSLPFDRFYSHLVFISLCIHTLIHFNKLVIKPIFTKRTLVLQSVFWVTVISTIYASNKNWALNEWGLDITILLMPLLLCINPIDLKRYRPQLLMVFAVSQAATIVYLYINAITTIRFYGMPLSALFSPAFTNHNFAQPIDMHATFFSMQIAIALIYVISALMKEGKMTNRIVYAIVSLILLAGIIQLSSKSVIIALFLTISIALPIFSLQGAHRVRFISIAASSAVIVFIILCNIRAFRDRYITELKEDFSTARPNQRVESRVLRWQLAADLIRQKPIIGHGAGSEIPLLQDQYFAKKYYTSYVHRLNAHNEYMSVLIKSGIWGLAVYIVTLIYGFRLAARKKDVVFFGFMLLLAMVSLSENILDVDKGVMFYSFFFPFFVFVAEQKSKLILPAKRHKNVRNVATNRMAVTSIE